MVCTNTLHISIYYIYYNVIYAKNAIICHYLDVKLNSANYLVLFNVPVRY